jgi:hypothetical protein
VTLFRGIVLPFFTKRGLKYSAAFWFSELEDARNTWCLEFISPQNSCPQNSGYDALQSKIEVHYDRPCHCQKKIDETTAHLCNDIIQQSMTFQRRPDMGLLKFIHKDMTTTSTSLKFRLDVFLPLPKIPTRRYRVIT